MLKAPKFWYKKTDTYLSNTLYPLYLIFRFGTKLRNAISRKSTSDLPVICIGNIVVGGAGKTPVALKLGAMLKQKGYNPHFVSKDVFPLYESMTVSDRPQQFDRPLRTYEVATRSS